MRQVKWFALGLLNMHLTWADCNEIVQIHEDIMD